MKNAATNASIQAQIAKGWKPNYYLTNMSVAHFSPMTGLSARSSSRCCR